MFSVNHFIWVGISLLLCTAAIVYLYKRRPALKDVLNVSCVLCVIFEVVKTFSVLQMVPNASGTKMHVFIELSHLPLHLCSIQTILVFYARFSKPGAFRDAILAFMYPTCIAGSVMAIAMPTIFSGSIQVSQAFTHPLAYQFFLYHGLLVVLGVYIILCKEVAIRPKHYWSTLAILGAMGYTSIYLNSMFADVTYKNGKLVCIEDSTNFFFTQRTPIGIKLTEMWHWYVYIAIIALLAVILIAVFYIPVFLRARKERQ